MVLGTSPDHVSLLLDIRSAKISPVKTVCILGMHRSGTSLLSNLLRQLGVCLGPIRDIMEPSKSDNPEGYWENIHFVELNDRILATLGGSWANPQNLEPGWSSDKRLLTLRGEAEGLAWNYAHLDLWGWKDPRTMLTLELWQQVIPDMKYVLIVRDPVEVAMSLARRTQFSVLFDNAITLWRRYHEIALQSVDLDQCLVVHYNSMQGKPGVEIKRIATFLGIELNDQLLNAARSVIKPSLHRNVFPQALADSLPIEREAQRIYGLLCSRSGVEPQELAQGGEDSSAVANRAGELVQVLLKGYDDVRRQSANEVQAVETKLVSVVQDCDSERAENLRLIKVNEDMATHQDALRRATKEQIEEQLANIRALKTHLGQQEEHIESLRAHIRGMEQSWSWRVTEPIRNWKSKRATS